MGKLIGAIQQSARAVHVFRASKKEKIPVRQNIPPIPVLRPRKRTERPPRQLREKGSPARSGLRSPVPDHVSCPEPEAPPACRPEPWRSASGTKGAPPQCGTERKTAVPEPENVPQRGPDAQKGRRSDPNPDRQPQASQAEGKRNRTIWRRTGRRPGAARKRDGYAGPAPLVSTV